MSETPSSRAAVAACSRCGEGLVPDDRFCGGCGARVNGCRNCGNVLVAGNRNCPQCGVAVDPAKVTSQLSKPGLSPTAETEWAEILAKVQAATIGELHFIKQLGRGGMAAVYLAEDIRLRRKVAVKLILPELMSDERMVRRFQEEASTVANMNHASIVQVFAVREAAGVHFFTMRYIEGRSLESVLEASGALPIPVVRSVLAQVASALGYAHRQGVFHRDVKPANILIDGEGNAFVTDFGIAKASKSTTQSKTLTQFGAVVGTPAYISPEQCLSRPVSGASDQYSLGVVAYEMVAGHPPFQDQNSFALMRCHTDEAVPPLRAQRSACPADLEEAIFTMLSKKPEDRFGSMAEASAALSAQVLPEDNPLRLAFAELAAPDPLPPDSSINTPPIRRVDAPAPKEARSTVAMINIAPPPESIEVGERLALKVNTRDVSGMTLPGVAVTWHSSDPEVATITSEGAVLAVSPGTVELTASAGRARATVLLSVEEIRAQDIAISVSGAELRVGDVQSCSAIVRGKAGSTLAGKHVSWSSTAPAIASIDEAGLLTCVTAGATIIVAECDGLSANHPVTVQRAAVATVSIDSAPESLDEGESCVLIAVARDERGNALPGRQARWQSSSAQVAAVSSDGALEAVGVGTVRITCTIEGKSATVTLVVTQPSVSAVQLSTPPALVTAGSSFRLTATAIDAQGAYLSGRVIEWKSGNPSLATVTSAGLVTALTAGSVSITAECESIVAAAEIRVAPAPVASVTVIGLPASLDVGRTVQASASVVDARGNGVERDVEWISSSDAIATVTGAGRVTAVAEGRVRIIATIDDVEAVADLAVTKKKIVVSRRSELLETPLSVSVPPPSPNKEPAPAISGTAVFYPASEMSPEDEHAAREASEARKQERSLDGERASPVPEAPPIVEEVPPAIDAAKAEQARKADEVKKAAEAAKSDRTRKAEEARYAEELRRAEGSRRAEEARLAEEARRLSATTAGAGVAPVAEARATKLGRQPAVPGRRSAIAQPKRNRLLIPGAIAAVVLLGAAGYVVLRPKPANGGQERTFDSTAARDAAPAPAVAIAPKPPVIATPSTLKLGAKLVPVAAVKLSGVPSQVIAGDQFNIAATPYAAKGVRLDRSVSMQFSTSDARVASIDKVSGRVVALAAGRVTITASGEGKKKSETFVIAPRTAASATTVRLVVTAPPPIRVGETGAFTLSVQPYGTSTAGMFWSSSNEGVAHVDARTGVVTGVAAGTAMITAHLGKMEQHDNVEIVPAAVASIQAAQSHTFKESETFHLSAVALDKQGRALRDRAISWSSDHPDVVSVSDDGTITAKAGGDARITASAEGQEAHIAVHSEAKPAPVPVPVAKAETPSEPDPAPARAAAAAAAAQQLAAKPAEILQALNSHDVDRALSMFAYVTADDKRFVDALRGIMGRPEFRAGAGGAGTPQMTDSDGTLTFYIRVEWVHASGRAKTANMSLEALATRTTNGWRVGRVKLLSEPK